MRLAPKRRLRQKASHLHSHSAFPRRRTSVASIDARQSSARSSFSYGDESDPGRLHSPGESLADMASTTGQRLLQRYNVLGLQNTIHALNDLAQAAGTVANVPCAIVMCVSATPVVPSFCLTRSETERDTLSSQPRRHRRAEAGSSEDLCSQVASTLALGCPPLLRTQTLEAPPSCTSFRPQAVRLDEERGLPRGLVGVRQRHAWHTAPQTPFLCRKGLRNQTPTAFLNGLSLKPPQAQWRQRREHCGRKLSSILPTGARLRLR